jgi:hypothetical protein
VNTQSNNGMSRVSVFGEFRPASINGLSNLDLMDTLTAGQVLAANLYTKVQVDALLDTHAPTIADGSLTIAKTADLQRQLDDINEIRRGQQGQISGNALAIHYTKLDLADLALVVGEKQQKIDSLSGLVVGTITASAISTLSLTTGTLESGPISCSVPGTDNNLLMAEFGTDSNILRLNGGAFIDSYKTSDNSGRTLYLNYLNNNSVQVGSKLAIGQPPNNFQFSCAGAGSFSSFCEAVKFTATSDRRLKSNIEPASVDECLRLVQTVRPMTFTRNDRNDEPQIGYVAQHWDSQLKDGFHNTIMAASEDADGPLLALDHSKICVILHGALLSALARIEALENRLT